MIAGVVRVAINKIENEILPELIRELVEAKARYC